jgi:hypothetical protein
VSITHEFGRFARSFGIVLVFAIVGPLVMTALFTTFLFALGVQMLQIMLAFFELDVLRPWLSIAAFLLLFFTFVATIPASAAAGIIFAITAVYGGMNSLWTAIVVVGIMVVGVVILGFFVSPSENSPLIVPSVQGLRQGFWLSLFLFVPAAIAASFCWLFSRPLHRVS